MHRRLIVVGLACGASSALLALPPATASDVTSVSPASAASVRLPTIAEQVRRRTDLGLRHDPAFIVMLQHEPAANATALRFGAVLQPREAAIAGRRDIAAQRLGSAVAMLRRQYGNTFAGAYLDPATGSAHLLMVQRDERLRLDVEKALGADTPVVLEPATFTLTELDQVRAPLARQFTRLADSQGVVSLAIDIRRNRVALGVTGKGQASATRTWLQEHYPTVARAVTINLTEKILATDGCGGCSTDGLPYKAGQQIVSNVQPNGYYYTCTAGFGVHRTGVFPNPTTYYQTSAGHCGPSGSIWSHYFYTEGTASSVHVSGNNDSELLTLQPQTAHSNLIFSNGSTISVTSSTAQSGYALGQTFCFFGERSGYEKCGNVTNTSYMLRECESAAGPCYDISDTVEGNNPALQGDSGGPVFSGGRAMGLTTAASTSSSYFTKIANVLSSQRVSLNVS